MFHGNGGNLGHRIPLASIFVMKMRCNVLMMCYRGCVCVHVVSLWSILTLNPPPQSYGLSGGSPSEKGMHIYNSSFIPYLTSYQGLRIDAQAGLDYLTSHPLFKNTPIVSAIHFYLLELDTTVLKDSIRAIDGRCSCN